MVVSKKNTFFAKIWQISENILSPCFPKRLISEVCTALRLKQMGEETRGNILLLLHSDSSSGPWQSDTNLQICRILKFDYYLAITSRTTSWRWVDIFEDIISWNIIWGYFPRIGLITVFATDCTETSWFLVQIFYLLAEILHFTDTR